MSAGVSSGGGGRGSESQDFELNIASIIDCFTVLIAFMLVSASFVAIGILDAGVAAAGATAASSKPPSVTVTVDLQPGHKFSVKLSGKANKTTVLAESKGDWDYAAMTEALQGVKKHWPDVSAITLTADGTIEYKDVVKTMEAARKTMPVVLLGGF